MVPDECGTCMLHTCTVHVQCTWKSLTGRWKPNLILPGYLLSEYTTRKEGRPVYYTFFQYNHQLLLSKRRPQSFYFVKEKKMLKSYFCFDNSLPTFWSHHNVAHDSLSVLHFKKYKESYMYMYMYVCTLYTCICSSRNKNHCTHKL